MQKKEFDLKVTRPVMISVFDQNNMNKYIEILKKLRSENISSEIYPGEGKIKKQMEYANKIGCPCVIFAGEEEIKKSEVKIKNLRTGKETNIKDENIVNEIKKIIWKYIKVNKIRGL